MGQKTHPIGFRLGISKTWRSTWFAKKDFPMLIKEDALLRKYLKARLGGAAIAEIQYAFGIEENRWTAGSKGSVEEARGITGARGHDHVDAGRVCGE